MIDKGKPMLVKGVTPELHHRFKTAAEAAGETYFGFLMLLLDEHDAAERD